MKLFFKLYVIADYFILNLFVKKKMIKTKNE